MNTSDFIEKYNRDESESRELLPNFLVKSFAPTTFSELGFQTEINSQNCLWKYIDTQHEGRYHDNLSLLNGKLTASEFELFQVATDVCIRFTKSIYKEIIPINALTRSLISYRAIKSYCASLNQIPSVLEVGPGSGYLGLLCGISGWQYSSLDVTKSLITYQNALWNFAGFKTKFAEAGITYSDSEFMQIPWWIWADTKNSLPKRKILVANHVIQEMTPFSLAFTVKRSKNIGAEFILAEGLGYGKYKNNMAIINKNSVLIHNNSLKTNYQKVWIWKIDYKEKILLDNTDFLESTPKTKKEFVIGILLENKILANLYSRINKFRTRIRFKSKMGELLDKDMANPSLTIDGSFLSDFIRSKKVSFYTEDELLMHWANYKGHT